MKVNNLENRISDASTLIQTNQYKAGKRNLGKKIPEGQNKILDVNDLQTTIAVNANIV